MSKVTSGLQVPFFKNLSFGDLQLSPQRIIWSPKKKTLYQWKDTSCCVTGVCKFNNSTKQRQLFLLFSFKFVRRHLVTFAEILVAKILFTRHGDQNGCNQSAGLFEIPFLGPLSYLATTIYGSFGNMVHQIAAWRKQVFIHHETKFSSFRTCSYMCFVTDNSQEGVNHVTDEECPCVSQTFRKIF